MLKMLMNPILMVAGLAMPLDARAGDYGCCTKATSAAFPTVNPPGWYTNTYSYAWYYPWYAYYNYSQGPYANWAAGGGYATYGYKKVPPPAAIGVLAIPATVSISIPADAKLLFSGKLAEGTGAIRSFVTPPLEPNQEYSYEMTAEVLRDGRTLTLTKTVIVRAGESVKVEFEPPNAKLEPPLKK